MKLYEVARILDAEVLAGEKGMDREVHTACGSDMMSDVLAFVKDQAMMITGLTNPQVVRTANMMDMVCIVFVRGKKPDASILQLAEDMGITILATKSTMFCTCGLLYQQGMRGECKESGAD